MPPSRAGGMPVASPVKLKLIGLAATLMARPLGLPSSSARGLATDTESVNFSPFHTSDPSPLNGLSRPGSDSFMLTLSTRCALPVRSSR